jgi:hypothetical protein
VDVATVKAREGSKRTTQSSGPVATVRKVDTASAAPTEEGAFGPKRLKIPLSRP